MKRHITPVPIFFPASSFQSIVKIFIVLFLIYFDLPAYEVKFQGVDDCKVLELVKDVSRLEKLKDSPPATLAGLRKRAESDMVNILQVFHTDGRYQAKGDYKIEENGSFILVTITPGPIYPFAAYEILYLQNGERKDDLPRCPITLNELNIQLGDAATPESILNAEDLILDHLNLQGYAFAKILKRDVFADLKAQNVVVKIEIETGPLTFFGPIKVNGLDRVKESFVYKKLTWHEKELYHPEKIEKTQEALDLSGLFRSVNISHAEEPIDGEYIPLTLNFIEAKQRTMGFGINFNTQLGPGISAEWEDRNILGEGQKLSFKTDLWYNWQYGSLRYLIPDYKKSNQNLIWQLNYEQGHRKAYSERAISLSAIIERRLNKRLNFSYGVMYKHLLSKRSENNGTFNLLKLPLQLKWTSTDDILDPSRGASLNLVCIPSLQFIQPQFAYAINTVTASYYKSLTQDKRFIFASKLIMGSIVGAGKHDIPPPERFYAGSQNTLRGYRFLTVSPIDKRHHDKPLGGRSMFVYSLELRSRITKEIGLVGFWDIGNVYSDSIPDFERRLLQSTGLGLRYYTPVGPLRLDIAFPLNRRKSIDNRMEIYFSIGQSF